jgi:hypothetical protein
MHTGYNWLLHKPLDASQKLLIFCIFSNLISFAPLRLNLNVNIQRKKQLSVWNYQKCISTSGIITRNLFSKYVMHRYDCIVDTLTYLSSNGRNGEERATSNGLINSMNKIETILLLNIFGELFELTTPLS